MKTSVQAFFASTLAAIVLSTSAFASSTDSTSIQKVIVKGNAKVYLVQREKESVKVYDTATNKDTHVTTQGRSLIINSNEAEPVTIMVYVNKPFRVEASNSSTVETVGNFSVDYLQVVLKDQARAKIKADTKGLYTVVKDQSNLKLSGTSDEHISLRGKESKLQMDNLASLKTNSSYFGSSTEANAKVITGVKIVMSGR
jgi:triphosphoribosyl-dephospho-CoA synthetase